MSTVFVTGATGFIGSKLVEILLNRGYIVRGLSRRPKPTLPPGYGRSETNLWQHRNFSFTPGDISDEKSLEAAMKGCDYVFHLAAYAKNWAPNPDTFTQMNIHGLRNVLDAAEKCRIRKIVWTSSIVTFGMTRLGVVQDESMPRFTEHCFTEYEETKYIAEKEALQRVKNGLPLVIVNPTRVYGPGQLSEGNALAQLIDDYTHGKAPFLPNRGINIGNYGFVDDVAMGHILALEKGKIGERYILGGENVSLKGFLEMIDGITGKKRIKIPLLKTGPLLFSWVQKKLAEIFGIYPRITPGWVRTFMVDWAYSCEKAKSELGYSPIPLRNGLKITLDWLSAIASNVPQTLITDAPAILVDSPALPVGASSMYVNSSATLAGASATLADLPSAFAGSPVVSTSLPTTFANSPFGDYASNPIKHVSGGAAN